MIRKKKTLYVFFIVVLTMAMLAGVGGVKTFFNREIKAEPAKTSAPTAKPSDKAADDSSDDTADEVAAYSKDDYGTNIISNVVVEYKGEEQEVETLSDLFLTEAPAIMPSAVFARYKNIDFYSSTDVKEYRLAGIKEEDGSLVCRYEAILTDFFEIKDGLENTAVNVTVRVSEGSDIEEVKERIETELEVIKMRRDISPQNTSVRKAGKYSVTARANGIRRAPSGKTHNVSGSYSTYSAGQIQLQKSTFKTKFEGIGRYVFNGTGAANVADAHYTINGEDTRQYIHCGNDDAASLEETTGSYGGNSSGAFLPSSNSEILKAYLVVEWTDEAAWADFARQDPQVTHKKPVISYEAYKNQITFAAKKGDDFYYLKTCMPTFCYGDTFRCSSYMDVTDFVKNYGYTYYYCANIPFRNDGLSYTKYGYSKSDRFAAWKLIVIEKDSGINPRYMRLDLGADDATWEPGMNPKTKFDSMGLFEDSLSALSGNKNKVPGTLLYSFAGGDENGRDSYGNPVKYPNKLMFRSKVNGKWEPEEYTYLYEDHDNARNTRCRETPLIDRITIDGSEPARAAYNPSGYTDYGADLAIESLTTDDEYGTTDAYVLKGAKDFDFYYEVDRVGVMQDAFGISFDSEVECENTIDTIIWDEANSQYVVYGTSKCTGGGYYGMRTNIYIPNGLYVAGGADISVTNDNVDNADISYSNENQNITIKWGKDAHSKHFVVTNGSFINWQARFTPSGVTESQRKGHDLRQNNWKSSLEINGIVTGSTPTSAPADGLRPAKASSTVETLTVNPRGGLWRSSTAFRYITKIVMNQKPGNLNNNHNEGIEDPTCPVGWRFNGWVVTEKGDTQNQWSSTAYTRDQWTATTWTSSFIFQHERPDDSVNAADYTIEAHYKRVESGLLVNLNSYTSVGDGYQTVLAKDWTSSQKKIPPTLSGFDTTLFRNINDEDGWDYTHNQSTTLSKSSQHTTDYRICQHPSSHKGRYQDTDTVPDPVPENYRLDLDFKDGWIEPTYKTPDDSVNATYSFPHIGSGYGDNRNTTYKEKTDRAFKDFSVSKVGNDYTQYGYDASNHIFTHPEMESDTYLRANYTGSYILYLPTVERYGYNFMGWYNAADDTLYTDDNTGHKIIMDKDLKLYAKWELITKDETFNVYWLDNSNNYSTRPEAVFVELYRISGDDPGDVCETYITEILKTNESDYITRFSNETGMTQVPVPQQGAGSNNRGDKSKGIWQPNDYYTDPTGKTDPTTTKSVYKDIFPNEDGSSYYVRISGNNSVPATTNTWTVTLKDLQKYDVTKKDTEYDYNIKEVDCTSLDRTTRYYTSSKKSENNYTTDISKYYKIKNYEGESSSVDYNDIAVNKDTDYFSNDLVNRITNVEGTDNWKSVAVKVTFRDGADKYRYRPYEMTVQLWQNIPYKRDTSSPNDLSAMGIRRLIKNQPLTPKLNPYSSVDDSHSIYVDGLSYIFDRSLTPTVQPESGIKYSYDVVLTHNQTRYRYTLDPADPYNNLIPSRKKSNGHYYSGKHSDITTSIIDLDYTKMTKNGALKTGVKPSEAAGLLAQGWEFTVPMDVNNIYQSMLNSQDAYSDQLNKIVLANGSNQMNYYESFRDLERGSYARAETAKAYTNPFCSLAYNLRYYYITEGRKMSTKDQRGAESIIYTTAKDESKVDDFHNVGYLKYKEYLHWDFACTLFGTPETSLPTEYTGSESADDRTGVYKKPEDNDDYTHTNNTLTVVSHVYDDYSNTSPEYDALGKPANGLYKNKIADGNTADYDRLDTAVQRESFLITLKQVQKNWTTNTAGTASDENGNTYNIHDGNNTGETYNNARYSLNGKRTNIYNKDTGMLIDIHESGLADQYLTGDMIQYGSDRIISLIGNEYNLVVPAQGSTTLEYIPDGKYEISCHYDIDFRDFEFDAAGRNVTFSYENQAGNEVSRGDKSGKWYVTFSSQYETSEETLTHKSEIDKWRGYVDDENTMPVHGTPAKDSKGYNVTIGHDDKISDKNQGTQSYPNGYVYYYRYWRNTYVTDPYKTMN